MNWTWPGLHPDYSPHRTYGGLSIAIDEPMPQNFLMIDSNASFASWFLWIAASTFMIGYALPLLLVPLRWARFFRWPDPGQNNLTIYFGRCLGALAFSVTVVCMLAAPNVSRYPLVLLLTGLASALMVLVHVYGLVTRTQPWTENLEILAYGAMTGFSAYALVTLPNRI